MTREIYSQFLPNKVVAFHPLKGEEARKIEALSPFKKNQLSMDSKTTAYVCKNYVCDFPTTDISKFKKLLEKYQGHHFFLSSDQIPAPWQAIKRKMKQ